MKRGVIMEVSKRKAVILTKDGSFERVRLRKGEHPVVGQEYILPTEGVASSFRPNRMVLPSFSLSLVAIIVFVLIAGGVPFGHQKASAAAYVSFDINPSIEVAVDQEMNVISVRALNEDAKGLLEGTGEYENSSLLYFSESLFEILKEQGYFDTYEDLLITSSFKSGKTPEEVRERLQKAIDRLKTDQNIRETDIVVSIREASSDHREKANELGISMGKFLVYQDAVKKDASFNLEQARAMSYSDLKKFIAAKENEFVIEPTYTPADPNTVERVNLETSSQTDATDSKPSGDSSTAIETTEQDKSTEISTAPSKDVNIPSSAVPKASDKKRERADDDRRDRHEEQQDEERDEDKKDGKNIGKRKSDESRSHVSKNKKHEGIHLRVKVKIGGWNGHPQHHDDGDAKGSKHLKNLDLLLNHFIHSN